MIFMCALTFTVQGKRRWSHWIAALQVFQNHTCRIWTLQVYMRYIMCKRAEERIQTSKESYNQRWFHTASSRGRPRRARCWCTCGRGHFPSVSNRSLCAVRRSIVPSPLSFCFRAITDPRREGRRKRGDMRNNHAWKCSALTFPANNGPETQRRQILALPQPRLVPSLSHSPLTLALLICQNKANINGRDNSEL